MSSRARAFQYAKGLFSVAIDLADVRSIGGELETFSTLLGDRGDLRQALTSGAVPPERKQAVVREVLALSPVSPLVAQFLLLLARHDHLGLLPAVVEEFGARVMDQLGIEHAEVTTAVPIADAVQAQIASSLSAATGREVRVSARVDPSIVGGVVARVGSLVFDGSVRRQLERLREQMASGA
jgi:F-type H+-transporting ATPase subunit delta